MAVAFNNFNKNNRKGQKGQKKMSKHEEVLSMINLRKEISENEMFLPDEFSIDGEEYSVFAGFGDDSKGIYLTDGTTSENAIIDQNTTSFEVDGKDPTLQQLQNIAMIARIGAALNESLTLGGREEFVEIGRGNYHAEFGLSDRIEKIRETAILIFSDLKRCNH